MMNRAWRPCPGDGGGTGIDGDHTYKAFGSRDTNASADIVVLSRNSAATSIGLGLRGRYTVEHIVSVEQFLTGWLTFRCIAAFVDCGLPVAIFRKIHSTSDGGPVRVIGIRDERRPHRPLELMAQSLIAAYIGIPITPIVVNALIPDTAGAPADSARSGGRCDNAR